MKKILLFLFYLVLSGYTIWSFTQTDRNLILINQSDFLDFQNWAWSIHPQTSTVLYTFFIVILFLLYALIIKTFQKGQNFSLKQLVIISIPVFLPLLFSYNALSHDIFNYIFNAKMVIVYGADPHVQTALDFAQDNWVRFMHNIHTPAPYFYGWTALSLLPFLIGFSKFITTWLAFKLFSGIGWILLLIFQFLLLQSTKVKKKWKIWLFILNPLVLLEILSTGHNDAWMMALALGSFWLIMKKNRSQPFHIVVSLLLLVASISIKYVTVVLLPLWLIVAFDKTVLCSLFESANKKATVKTVEFVKKYLFDISAILLLLPLLTARSQWFHPWYLIWSLSFLPFIQLQWLRVLLLAFSVSSMLRYIPWMWAGSFEFTPEILMQQRLITWGVGGVLFGVWWMKGKLLKIDL